MSSSSGAFLFSSSGFGCLLLTIVISLGFCRLWILHIRLQNISPVNLVTPSSFFIHSVSPATICRIPVFRDLFFFFSFFLREFIFLMNLKLVRRSTLSTLPSAPEYSETRLVPSKEREKGKRRETEKEKKERPKHLGSGSGYPIQSVLLSRIVVY